MGAFDTLDGFRSLSSRFDVTVPALTCADGGTIRSQAARSYTQFVPLHDVDAALSLLPPGHSELPDSPWHLSALESWRRGTLHPTPLSRRLILPRDNAPEAAVCEDVEVIGIGTLAEAVGFLEDRLPLEPTAIDINDVFNQASQYDIDFAEVRGQESAKRALTIAAAGGHNVLTLGPSARNTRCSRDKAYARNSHLRHGQFCGAPLDEWMTRTGFSVLVLTVVWYIGDGRLWSRNSHLRLLRGLISKGKPRQVGHALVAWPAAQAGLL